MAQNWVAGNTFLFHFSIKCFEIQINALSFTFNFPVGYLNSFHHGTIVIIRNMYTCICITKANLFVILSKSHVPNWTSTGILCICKDFVKKKISSYILDINKRHIGCCHLVNLCLLGCQQCLSWNFVVKKKVMPVGVKLIGCSKVARCVFIRH